MNAVSIHRAEGFGKKIGKVGRQLTPDQKLRMYTAKEIFKTEEEYVKLLKFIVEVKE